MRIRTRWRKNRLAYPLLLFILPGLMVLSAPPATGQDARISPPLRGTPTISLIPSASSIVLSPGTPDGVNRLPGFHPFQGYARFDLRVQSAMPTWGATLAVSSIDGPEGPVPADRLWVRSTSTGNEFVPAKGLVPVVTGDYRQPVKDEPVEVLFRPAWNDPAGIYRFKLFLNPFDPGSARAGGGNLVGPRGGREPGSEISGEYKNHQVVLISIEDTEIHFEILPGPGVYESDDDIALKIWTNAEAWRVDCEATALKSGQNEIPLDRLRWERIDEYGRTVQAGNMATNPTILSGYGRVEALETKLRFKVDILPADIAGSYQGTLSLVGYVQE